MSSKIRCCHHNQKQTSWKKILMISTLLRVTSVTVLVGSRAGTGISAQVVGLARETWWAQFDMNIPAFGTSCGRTDLCLLKGCIIILSYFGWTQFYSESSSSDLGQLLCLSVQCLPPPGHEVLNSWLIWRFKKPGPEAGVFRPLWGTRVHSWVNLAQNWSEARF